MLLGDSWFFVKTIYVVMSYYIPLGTVRKFNVDINWYISNYEVLKKKFKTCTGLPIVTEYIVCVSNLTWKSKV